MAAFRLQTVALCRLSEALLARNTTTVLDFCAAILHTKLFPRIISARQHESASPWFASIAQLVEHRSRKAGVIGSSPIAGSSCNVTPPFGEAFFVLRNPAPASIWPIASRSQSSTDPLSPARAKNFSICCSLTGRNGPVLHPPPEKSTPFQCVLRGFAGRRGLEGLANWGFVERGRRCTRQNANHALKWRTFFPAGGPRAEREGGPVRFAPSVCSAGRPQAATYRKVFVLGCRARWARFVDAPRNHSEASTR